MERSKNLTIWACFVQSFVLTRDNFLSFVGASIIAWIFSILTFSLLFPALMTGLETMFLRAKAGEPVKATDVFMHRRKWWSLYIDTLVIGWHASWFAMLLLLPMLFVFMLLINLGIAASQIKAVFQITGFLIFLVVCYRESRHLHALNLAADFGL